MLLKIKGKTIIFNNDLDSLHKITPNVVSSRLSLKQNKNIVDSFNSNKIKNIASFKKLKQGENLIDLSNCIVMSYYSSDGDLIQRAGRLREDGKLGNLFIIVTKNTREEVWFNSMIGDYKDYDITYYKNINECLKNLN